MPKIANCLACPYREFGGAIGSRGDEASRIVLVGEAPGAKEMDGEEPFVGPAGDVLWKAASEAGLSEADVFVVNSVACRPFNPLKPKVRAPSPEAIEACHGRFVRDVTLVHRAVIVALGATAVQALTGQRGFAVTEKNHGTELESTLGPDWGPVVPTVHPAYILRRGSSGPMYQMLVADLKYARGLVRRAGPMPASQR